LDQRNWHSSCSKGFVWFTDGSKIEGTGAEVYWQSVGRRLSFSLGRYATVFQAEIYAILACVYEIQFQSRPEKYMSICSDSQVSFESSPGCQNISIGPTVTKSVGYLYPACSGAVLGPWTCWSTE